MGGGVGMGYRVGVGVRVGLCGLGWGMSQLARVAKTGVDPVIA